MEKAVEQGIIAIGKAVNETTEQILYNESPLHIKHDLMMGESIPASEMHQNVRTLNAPINLKEYVVSDDSESEAEGI